MLLRNYRRHCKPARLRCGIADVVATPRGSVAELPTPLQARAAPLRNCRRRCKPARLRCGIADAVASPRGSVAELPTPLQAGRRHCTPVRPRCAAADDVAGRFASLHGCRASLRVGRRRCSRVRRRCTTAAAVANRFDPIASRQSSRRTSAAERLTTVPRVYQSHAKPRTPADGTGPSLSRNHLRRRATQMSNEARSALPIFDLAIFTPLLFAGWRARPLPQITCAQILAQKKHLSSPAE
jgi:hypothetical protein